MSAITPVPEFFDLSLLMPQSEAFDSPFDSKGVKRKSFEPPQLSRKLSKKAAVRHDVDLFIKLIRSVHASVALLVIAGVLVPKGTGCCMEAYLNLKTKTIRKFFKDPVLDLIKHEPFSGQILKENMISELGRYHRLLTLNIRVATIFNSSVETPLAPVECGFYDQEYIEYPLPKVEALPQIFVNDLTTLVRTAYDESFLIDISPCNFGCRTPDSDLTLFDFGINPSDEIDGRRFQALTVDEKQEALEDYRLHILSTLSGYLLSWEKLYPNTYMLVMEECKATHPPIYDFFNAVFINR